MFGNIGPTRIWFVPVEHDGPPVPVTDDQWFNACTANGSKQWPYGTSANQSSCNTQDNTNISTFTVDVGSLATCVGGYPGIFDMSGNVRESEDACESEDKAANCLYRGGSYALSSDNASCDEFHFDLRHHYDLDVGFRCCADL